MATQKERFLSYMQTCVKSTRATDSNPLFLGGNAPKEYARFLEPDRLFDYNPSKWTMSLWYHLGRYLCRLLLSILEEKDELLS